MDRSNDLEVSISEYADCLHERAGNIIQYLFRLLEATPPTANPLVTIHLSIPLPLYIFGASMHEHPPGIIPRPYRLPIKSLEKSLVDVGSKSIIYLKLAQEVYQELPDLRMVSTFMVSLDADGATFEPRFICLLASKMSRLEIVQWELSDAEKRDCELRIRQRDGMLFLLGLLAINLTTHSLVPGLADNMDKLPISLKEFAI